MIPNAGYQPNDGGLDASNPPKGSGVPKQSNLTQQDYEVLVERVSYALGRIDTLEEKVAWLCREIGG